ncbi:putative filamentous phage Phi Lf replication initiation protein II [Xanthomonas citri pv. fuscans]|nr:putative filamentous phage Phi Lf replication initiation protein II [Xanthomonas citri pv. fuscans]
MWRKGGKITDAHLMALIELAQADPALAVKVRQEEAASPAEQKAWSALWDRLSPVTTVIGALALVAIGMHIGAHEALLKALSPFVLTAPSIHYAK